MPLVAAPPKVQVIWLGEPASVLMVAPVDLHPVNEQVPMVAITLAHTRTLMLGWNFVVATP